MTSSPSGKSSPVRKSIIDLTLDDDDDSTGDTNAIETASNLPTYSPRVPPSSLQKSLAHTAEDHTTSSAAVTPARKKFPWKNVPRWSPLYEPPPNEFRVLPVEPSEISPEIPETPAITLGGVRRGQGGHSNDGSEDYNGRAQIVNGGKHPRAFVFDVCTEDDDVLVSEGRPPAKRRRRAQSASSSVQPGEVRTPLVVNSRHDVGPSKSSGQTAVDAIEARFKPKTPLQQAQRASQKRRIKSDEDHVVDWQKMGPYADLFIEQMTMSAFDEEQPWISAAHTSLGYDETGDTTTFKRVFIGPPDAAAAWEHGFKFLAVDGCHLRTRWKATLLASTTRDSNNEIFPLNWAITEGESENAWAWFFRSHRLHIPQLAQEAAAPLTSESPVFISDRGSGLLPASEAAFSGFRRAFPGHRFGHTTQSIAECFNSVIKSDRELSPLELLQSIFLRVCQMRNQRLHRAQALIEQGHLYTPYALRLLKYSMTNCFEYNANITSSEPLVAHCTKNDAGQLVTIVRWDKTTGERRCDCLRFQDQQFPCVHAAAALTKKGRDVKEAIGHQYLLVNLIEAYHTVYQPFVIDELQPEKDIFPPTKEEWKEKRER